MGVAKFVTPISLMLLMQSAFTMIWRFPPPSPSAYIFAELNGACTGFAAYTGIASIMKFVIRNMMLLDVVPHLLFRPRNKWIDLDELVHLVPLYHLHVLPCHTLFSAQTAYPDIKTLESAGQRLQLAYLAATMTTFYRVIKEIDALFSYHALHFTIVRKKHFQLNIVCQVGFVYQLVSLREKPTSIDTLLHRTDYQFCPKSLCKRITIIYRFLKIVSCVDMHQRKRNLGRIERLIGKMNDYY